MKLITACLVVGMLLVSCQADDEDSVRPGDNQKPDTLLQIVEIETSFGLMHVWLHKETPLHRANFITLATSGFYNNTTFHRIMPGFVIQGGDPNSKDSDPGNDGTGGPGYTIPAEILDTFKNERGSVATARIGNNQNPTKASSGSQFYINMIDNNALNNEYTVFGKVISGMQVADSIVIQPRNTATNRPLTNISMQVRILELTPAEIQSRFGFMPPL